MTEVVINAGTCSYMIVWPAISQSFISEVYTEHLQCIFMSDKPYHGVSFQQNTNETLKWRKQYINEKKFI